MSRKIQKLDDSECLVGVPIVQPKRKMGKFMKLKFWTWKWYDGSRKADPKTRDQKWEFAIPYVLKANGSIFSFHGGFSFHLWFLCFGIDWITDVSCGRVFRIRPSKWYLSLVIRHGWSLELYIGVDRVRISDWQVRRMILKGGPEKLKEVISRLRELLA